ncbi:hypothetical protein QM996_02500 [Sinorhizobium chiapasense]
MFKVPVAEADFTKWLDEFEADAIKSKRLISRLEHWDNGNNYRRDDNTNLSGKAKDIGPIEFYAFIAIRKFVERYDHRLFYRITDKRTEDSLKSLLMYYPETKATYSAIQYRLELPRDSQQMCVFGFETKQQMSAFTLHVHGKTLEEAIKHVLAYHAENHAGK